MTDKFNQLQAQWKEAQEQAVKANQKVAEIRREMDEERPNLLIQCKACRQDIRVGDIELIEESYGGSFDYDRDDWVYSLKKYFACPHCTEVLKVPAVSDTFPNGIDRYVKIVLKWSSDSQRCSGRILELLTPSRQRRAEKEAAEKKEQELEHARKLLREAGEL